ncbi:MAG: hypothetical protein M3146_08295 [Thermoproteota archaeon]|nr:hypothetical protein [Thermoproteota archaeon]
MAKYGVLLGVMAPALCLKDGSVDEVVVVIGVFHYLLFTSLFIPSLELYKMVFNIVLLFYNMIAYRE